MDKLAEIVGAPIICSTMSALPANKNSIKIIGDNTDNYGPWLRRSISVAGDNFVRAKTVRPEGC
jgi:hypothetical protein